MIFYTEKFGFSTDDLDAVTAELSRVLEKPAKPRFGDSRGGDYSAFGKYDEPGGGLSLYHNHFHDGIEPDIQEEDFPELGLILLIEHAIERDADYVDYEPVLKEMRTFEPVLLYRSRYPDGADKAEVLFDLAKEEGRSAPQ